MQYGSLSYWIWRFLSILQLFKRAIFLKEVLWEIRSFRSNEIKMFQLLCQILSLTLKNLYNSISPLTLNCPEQWTSIILAHFLFFIILIEQLNRNMTCLSNVSTILTWWLIRETKDWSKVKRILLKRHWSSWFQVNLQLGKLQFWLVTRFKFAMAYDPGRSVLFFVSITGYHY